MLVYKDYLTFAMMGKEINVISSETVYGRSTVVEIEDHYYYMDNEPPNVATAIFAWQEVNGRDLTSEELRQVMVENNIISQAI